MGVSIVCLQVYLSQFMEILAPNGLNASIRTWGVSLSLSCVLWIEVSYELEASYDVVLPPYTYLWTWTRLKHWISKTMRDTSILTSDSDSSCKITLDMI